MPTQQVPGPQPALAFDFDFAAVLESESFVQRFADHVGDVYSIRGAARFHPAGGVYGIAPQIVDEFTRADDAGDNRSGVDADPNAQLRATSHVELADALEHAERETGHFRGMIRLMVRYATHRHVTVTDCLDLLDAIPRGDFVKLREEIVEHLYQRLR